MNPVSVINANTLKRSEGTSPVAFEEIRRNARTQFDPEIVAAFERLWSSGKELYRSPAIGDFEPVLP
jgi:HD-GYP domain-containing protein (c-di-GMP phosphodiesterase class II)